MTDTPNPATNVAPAIPSDTTPDAPKNAADLLQKMLDERGYALSYHVLFGHHDPEFLDKYAQVYRYANLTPRFLTNEQRELCWVALLGAQKEPIGSLHVERAIDVGLSNEELAAAIALAGVADSWPTIGFAARQWSNAIHAAPESIYHTLIEAARGPISTIDADLILLTVQGVRRRDDPFIYHLRRLIDAGVSEAGCAEALTYLQLQAGNNTLLWAGDAWLAALRDGRLPESPTLGRAAFPTRTE